MAGAEGGAEGGAGGNGGGGNGGEGNAGASSSTPPPLQVVSAEHLAQILALNPGPGGIATLAAILNEAVAAGIKQGNVTREREEKEAAEKKAAERKRKRDEREETGMPNPVRVEKQRRREERDKLRKEREQQRKREDERKRLPLITLGDEGVPTEMAYTGAKSTIRHIVATNFSRGIEWGSLDKQNQKRCIQQVKDAFRNGAEIDSQWLADKIANSMSQARYHDRVKIRNYLRDLWPYARLRRPLQFSEDVWDAFYHTEVQIKAAKELMGARLAVQSAREAGKSDRELKGMELLAQKMQDLVDEVGDPPQKFLKAAQRVAEKPNITHRMGQGGLPGLKAAFVSALPLLLLSPFLQQKTSQNVPTSPPLPPK